MTVDIFYKITNKLTNKIFGNTDYQLTMVLTNNTRVTAFRDDIEATLEFIEVHGDDGCVFLPYSSILSILV